MAQVIEALRERATGPACIGLSPDAETPLGNVPFHPKSAFLALEAKGQPSSHLGLQLVGTSADGGKLGPSPLHLHMHQQPHLGVEMEDDTSGDTSNNNARPPLPIPPPFTDLVLPIESFSSEADMELEDVDMEKE
ncbi:hypothetical protein PAXRUDRAFT_22308 [Paxillus rubicundulus Ve08.2h10]|uniref:Uncharacterized protein n=1 Tax=Paxillus rubicundulus Ve08.2h10 TaxID=930991 RepID=A0A0D0BKI1_9AGAM|nr:hypothetical protein PAXRUDRAFT_22308 [Paxillus rubicundulus Ve08.2h10]